MVLEQHVSVSVDPDVGASKPSASTGLTAVGVVAGVAMLAGLVQLLRSQQQAAAGGELNVSPGRPMQQLLSDIDATLGRMAGVMVRLVRARLGLLIAPTDDDDAVALATGSSASPPVGGRAAAASLASPSGSPGLPGTPLAGGGRLGGPTVAAAYAAPMASSSPSLPEAASLASDAPFPSQASSSPRSSSPSPAPSNWQIPQPAAPGVPAPAPPTPGQALELALHMQAPVGAGSRLAADQVLAMMAEEGDNVGRVIDRLMKQKGNQN